MLCSCPIKLKFFKIIKYIMQVMNRPLFCTLRRAGDWGGGISESLCPFSVCLSGFCPDNIFWTAQLVLTKLGIAVHCHETECRTEKKHTTGLLSLRSRSQRAYMKSECDCFYYILWIADPFATRLGLMEHPRKPECLVKGLDCCVQAAHSKGSKRQRIFVRTISSEPLHICHWTW